MPPQTEKAKMLAGVMYNCLDGELEAGRQQARVLLRRYNTAEAEPDRQDILRLLLGSVGRNCIIEPPFYCSYGPHIHLGDNVFMNVLCTILDAGGVHKGNHVMFGPAVQIYTPAHALDASARIQGLEVAKAIVIEDNVWLGGAAVLLPGVKIGRNAVVGAGAVVTRDVPANTVVAGNPARVIRRLEQDETAAGPSSPNRRRR